MKRSKMLLAFGAASFLILLSQSDGALAGTPAHAYIGADKCKMCHNAPVKGAQYTRWTESRHSKAFQTLATEEAKKAAAAKGIADPQKAPDCLKCHVTGYGAPADKLTEKYRAEEGVTCEACHGPGSDYWKMETMKDRTRSQAAGLILPDEKTCRGCHNPESPSYKEFNFQVFSAKIAHPNPQKTGK